MKIISKTCETCKTTFYDPYVFLNHNCIGGTIKNAPLCVLFDGKSETIIPLNHAQMLSEAFKALESVRGLTNTLDHPKPKAGDEVMQCCGKEMTDLNGFVGLKGCTLCKCIVQVQQGKASANFGSNPTVKERIIDLLTKQTEKGLSKYGHTLDDCPDEKYDWRLMAMEELIDLAQYQQKEIMRLEKELNAR
jgi:hypothetical protein